MSGTFDRSAFTFGPARRGESKKSRQEIDPEMREALREQLLRTSSLEWPRRYSRAPQHAHHSASLKREAGG
jgi:hypothetical protein